MHDSITRKCVVFQNLMHMCELSSTIDTIARFFMSGIHLEIPSAVRLHKLRLNFGKAKT